MHYNLREGLSFCEIDQQFIFLDTINSRYFTLSATANAVFSCWINNQNLRPETLDPLHAVGILICAPNEAFLPDACQIAIPQLSYLDGEPADLRQVARAVGFLTRANITVRRHQLANIISFINQRKLANADCPAGDRHINLQVGSALQTAQWLISTQDSCLAKSIAAMWMLSGRDDYAKMIFGVRMHPFMAHCWVQNEQGLITDRFEDVETFTPILVV